MRILFLTNNPISIPLYLWLKEVEEAVFLYGNKVKPELIKAMQIDFLISYNYRYFISKKVLELFEPCRRINLHISYLPYNRGAYPNVWSFLENTPKGVSIHILTPELDKGGILLQEKVDIDENKHTLKSSYELLHNRIQELFKRNWNLLRNCSLKPKPQEGKGSFHTKREFEEKIKPLIDDYGWDIPIKVLKERFQKLSNQSNPNLKAFPP